MPRIVAWTWPLALPAAALAQSPSLVGGTWFHNETVPDALHPGQIMRVALLAQFTQDGHLTMRWAQAWNGGGFESIGNYSYRPTGPGAYSAVLNDYEPKQDCSNGIACLPLANPFGQVGARGECQYSFRSAVVVDIACGDNPSWRWTRQDGF